MSNTSACEQWVDPNRRQRRLVWSWFFLPPLVTHLVIIVVMRKARPASRPTRIHSIAGRTRHRTLPIHLATLHTHRRLFCQTGFRFRRETEPGHEETTCLRDSGNDPETIACPSSQTSSRSRSRVRLVCASISRSPFRMAGSSKQRRSTASTTRHRSRCIRVRHISTVGSAIGTGPNQTAPTL